MAKRRSMKEIRKAATEQAKKTHPDDLRKKPKRKTFCGAKKKDGNVCMNRPGHGTNHPGVGKCKYHGGSAPSHMLNAYKKEAVFLGSPKDINPVEALVWCIKITAGEVEWYNEQLQNVEPSQWYEESILGRQLHILAKERQGAVDRLAKYSKDAISLGIAERAVRMAEMYGASLAYFIKGVLDDLNLTPDQKHIAPAVIRKHLVLMEGGKGMPAQDPVHSRKAITAKAVA